MTTATASSVDQFVERLLTAEDAEARRLLIERAELPPGGVHDAVLRILDEVERSRGADPHRAEAICGDARILAGLANDVFLQAMTQSYHGEVLRYRGRNAEACAHFDEAAAVFRRLNRAVEAARTRIGWINAASKLGRADEALAVARSARRILEEHGETLRIAQLDLNVGNIHLDRGRYATALRCFTGSLALSRSLGEPGRINAARSQFNRGLMLLRLGRYREALQELDQARALHQSLGQTSSCARADLSIGLVHMDLGRYSRALRALDGALTTFRALGLSSDAVWAAFQTADCYLAMGRPAEAIMTLTAAEEDLREVDYTGNRLAVATRRVAAYMALGQQDTALSALNEAERSYPAGAVSHRAWLVTRRSDLLLRQGLAADALAAALRARLLARAAGLRRLVAEASIVQGSALLNLKRVAEADRVTSRARRQARSVDSAPLLYRACALLGRVAEAQGRPALACRRYSEAIHQLEREQRGVIFDFRDSFAIGHGEAYERLAWLQLQAGRAAESLATAEQAKSRALTDAIAGKVELRPRGNVTVRRLVRELDGAREAYAAATARAAREHEPPGSQAYARAGERPDELERRIASLRERLQIAGVDELAGAALEPALPSLPAGAAMVEFFFSGDDILRFQVDASGVRGDLLDGAAPEVERLLRAFRLNLVAAERAGAGQSGRLTDQACAILARLYGSLLGTLEGLDWHSAIIVVPHGLLHYLPFHALFDGERYLVERFPVSYAPSAALYTLCRARPRRRGKALVLAHSDGGRLPFAAEEAAAVGQVLHAPVHQEGAASRALLEREGRRAGIIHIAAHGRFRPDAPLFSSIELGDGPLTTADVFSLDLRASLVTLSACETGRSVLGGGDELAGLARAFLYAGAANLLVSQWRVDDASTASLMARFYRELQQGHDAAAALRSAQIAFVSGGVPQNGPAHPFYWASFQLIGDGQGF